jgi:hypothetical protein
LLISRLPLLTLATLQLSNLLSFADTWPVGPKGMRAAAASQVAPRSYWAQACLAIWYAVCSVLGAGPSLVRSLLQTRNRLASARKVADVTTTDPVPMALFMVVCSEFSPVIHASRPVPDSPPGEEGAAADGVPDGIDEGATAVGAGPAADGPGALVAGPAAVSAIAARGRM